VRSAKTGPGLRQAALPIFEQKCSEGLKALAACQGLAWVAPPRPRVRAAARLGLARLAYCPSSPDLALALSDLAGGACWAGLAVTRLTAGRAKCDPGGRPSNTRIAQGVPKARGLSIFVVPNRAVGGLGWVASPT